MGARLKFKSGWSLPHNERDWFSLLPKELDGLWDFWNEFEPEGFNDDNRDEYHTILGWPAGGLDDHSGFTAPPGCRDDINDYEMLVRLTFDNVAGFGWGTNWVYVLAPKSDILVTPSARACEAWNRSPHRTGASIDKSSRVQLPLASLRHKRRPHAAAARLQDIDERVPRDLAPVLLPM